MSRYGQEAMRLRCVSRAARAFRSFDWIVAINGDLCSFTESQHLHLAVPQAVFKVSIIKGVDKSKERHHWKRLWLLSQSCTLFQDKHDVTSFQKHGWILPFGLANSRGVGHILQSSTPSIFSPSTSNKQCHKASRVLATGGQRQGDSNRMVSAPVGGVGHALMTPMTCWLPTLKTPRYPWQKHPQGPTLYDRTQPHRQTLRDQQQKGKLEERATTEVLMYYWQLSSSLKSWLLGRNGKTNQPSKSCFRNAVARQPQTQASVEGFRLKQTLLM